MPIWSTLGLSALQAQSCLLTGRGRWGGTLLASQVWYQYGAIIGRLSSDTRVRASGTSGTAWEIGEPLKRSS